MGILDDLNGIFNKGVEGASRIADTTSLKFRLAEAERKRRDLMAQLGESLLGTVSADASLRAGREDILAGIAAQDAARAEIQAQLDSIARKAAEAKEKSAPLTCASCGSTLAPAARFCSTCGAPARITPDAQPASAAQGAQGAAQQTPCYTQAHAAGPQRPGAQDAGCAQAAPQQPGTSAQSQPQPTAAQAESDAAPAQVYEVPER